MSEKEKEELWLEKQRMMSKIVEANIWGNYKQQSLLGIEQESKRLERKIQETIGTRILKLIKEVTMRECFQDPRDDKMMDEIYPKG